MERLTVGAFGTGTTSLLCGDLGNRVFNSVCDVWGRISAKSCPPKQDAFVYPE